jgi:predicted transcriptional regulator of viral defense system
VWNLMREIRGSDSTPPVDTLVAALARRQHGVVERKQLRAIGLGADAIAYRAKTGRLHRIHPGVYAVGHAILSLSGLFTAATLACGDGAVLSHSSAAELHGLLKSGGARVEVSCPRRCRPSRSLTVHRTRTLGPPDVTEVDWIPVTSVARTLLDLADVAPQRHVERALQQADVLRVFDLAALEDVLSRATGRRTKIVRAALEQQRQRPAPTRSELEEAFLALVDEAGIERPRMNTHVCGYEVDAHWPDHRLAVELDSFKYHRTRRAFESDRRRDIALQAAGLRTARFTDARIEHEPQSVLEDLQVLVDSTPSRSS